MQSSSSNLERSAKRYDSTLASLHESAGVALFGGSFDPVHRGHLAIAEAALALGVVDRVVFIPSAQSPLKGSSPYASQAHRLAMLHLVAERDDFAVDTVELYRGGISYSSDTVRTYRKAFSGNLYWLLGADQFYQLENWHDYAYLLESVHFLVYPREGFPLDKAPLSRIETNAFTLLNLPLCSISSTLIREHCQQQLSLEYYLPEAVAEYIQKHSVYPHS
tara:strand:+ start:27 stop:686 length:660 start_codon:yes stop_codon:yes gene_type:complete